MDKNHSSLILHYLSRCFSDVISNWIHPQQQRIETRYPPIFFLSRKPFFMRWKKETFHIGSHIDIIQIWKYYLGSEDIFLCPISCIGQGRIFAAGGHELELHYCFLLQRKFFLNG